jgi:hypothetical protein
MKINKLSLMSKTQIQKPDSSSTLETSGKNSSNNITIEIRQPKEKKKTIFKSNRGKKIPLKKGQWSPQEDKLLKQWVQINGPKKWEACGRFIQGRKGKQCREHWKNCLNPDLLKGKWTHEEDFLIMFFYPKCKESWKKIIPLFNGRIENSIKNRFYSQLRKYATKDMEPKERKRLSSKIKLDELKNYLNEALEAAKADLIKKRKMTEEQFNAFIEKQEQKLKENIFIEGEHIESNLSTNKGDSFTEEDSNNIFLQNKRNRTKDVVNENINMNDFKNSGELIEFGEKNLNKNDVYYLDNFSNDNNFFGNNLDDKNNNDINIDKINNDISNSNNNFDEQSINYIEYKNDNSLINIYIKDCYKNEYQYKNNYIDNTIFNSEFKDNFEIRF